MSKLQQLRERRKELAKAIRQHADKMNAEGYASTGEDQANWEKINADYNAVVAAVEREETADRLDRETNTPDPDRRYGARSDRDDPRARGGDAAEAATDRMRSLALSAWVRCQLDMDLTAEQERACRIVGMNPQRRQLTFNLLSTDQLAGLQEAYRGTSPARARGAGLEFLATLSNQSGPSGGYLIPPLTLMRNLEINLLAYGGVLESSEIITTATGERMGWPTADDTTNKGVRLGASSQAAPSAGGTGQGTDPTFGQVYWDAYKYSSRAVLVPYELIEDADADVPGVVGEMLGVRLGRIGADELTTGTGNAMPKGIVTAAGAGYTTSKAAKIAADDLMNLEHTVDPAYRTGPGVGYMMHDKILLQVRLLKDGDGQYLYKSGANFGAPDTINGRGITINQSMASVLTSGTTVMLFGDLRRYKVRRVNGVRLYRLEERYRDTDQDGFIALMRMDGNLLTAGTNPVQKLVTL
jgi:HK97 family phage major capsid protein